MLTQACFLSNPIVRQNAYIAEAYQTLVGTPINLSCAGSDALSRWYVYQAISTMGETGIAGVIDGSNAAAGFVGEYISAAKNSGSLTPLTNSIGANVFTIALTPGDWEVRGNINFITAAATTTGFKGGVSTTSGTVPSDGTELYGFANGTNISTGTTLTIPPTRFNLTANTNVYVVAGAAFTAGTVNAFGSYSARRIR